MARFEDLPYDVLTAIIAELKKAWDGDHYYGIFNIARTHPNLLAITAAVYHRDEQTQKRKAPKKSRRTKIQSEEEQSMPLARSWPTLSIMIDSLRDAERDAICKEVGLPGWSHPLPNEMIAPLMNWNNFLELSMKLNQLRMKRGFWPATKFIHFMRKLYVESDANYASGIVQCGRPECQPGNFHAFFIPPCCSLTHRSVKLKMIRLIITKLIHSKESQMELGNDT